MKHIFLVRDVRERSIVQVLAGADDDEQSRQEYLHFASVLIDGYKVSRYKVDAELLWWLVKEDG